MKLTPLASTPRTDAAPRAAAVSHGPTPPLQAEVGQPRETVEISAAPTPPAAEAIPVEPRAAEAPAAAPVPGSSGTLQVGENGSLAVLDAGPARPVDRDEKFLARYGPWGIVTGASGGIGSEFARALAEKGMDVVLVARSGPKMADLAKDLREEYGVAVRVVAADLARPEGQKSLMAATSDLEVGLLVNNAGSWQFGSFLDNDIQKDVDSVGLNVEAPMVLSHHFAGKMAERGRGGVINVGSGAGLHGVPGQAAYSATKGFLQNFSQSLYRELKPRGVDVLITNPGPVEGEASAVYDQAKVPLKKVTGRQVATDALKHLGRGSTTIPGWFNKLAMNLAVRAMPRDLLTGLAGYILEKASD